MPKRLALLNWCVAAIGGKTHRFAKQSPRHSIAKLIQQRIIEISNRCRTFGFECASSMFELFWKSSQHHAAMPGQHKIEGICTAYSARVSNFQVPHPVHKRRAGNSNHAMRRSIHRHPRFAELRNEVLELNDWFAVWSGIFFRFQTLEYPAAKDILSGRGAAIHGGRWNLPGIHALYGSTTDSTALEECKANDRYYGLVTKSPRLVVAVECRLQRMLDLTKPALRRKLGFTLAELAAEDWRRLLTKGRESLSMVIGRSIVEAGGSGLIAPSAAVKRGVNIVVFPGACRGDQLHVVESEKLEKLGVRLRG